MHNLPFLVVYTSLNLIIFGCDNTSKIRASLNASYFSVDDILLKSTCFITQSDELLWH